MKAVVNPANAITASRYLTVPFFVYFVHVGAMQWAMVALLYCGFADLFDGAVARAFNCMSPFGEMFDAATDAICYGAFIATLAVYGQLPLVPVIGITFLGVINAVFRLVYAKRVGRTTNYRSFAMERVVANAAYLVGFGVAEYEAAYNSWVCMVLMAITLVHDSKRMLWDPVPA